jgi:hypothetical protein
MLYMPLIAEDPPRTFPRGQDNLRLFALACTLVEYIQSYGDPTSELKYVLVGVSTKKKNIKRLRRLGGTVHTDLFNAHITRWACLQHKHGVVSVFGEASGQYKPCRATAGYDEVIA